MNKSEISLPETVTVKARKSTETRRLTNLIYSRNRSPNVAWESPTSCGVCMQSVWMKWHRDGVDNN